MSGWADQLRRAANRTRRALRRGDYWYWLPPDEVPETLSVADLVYPLRYDVVIRRSLVELYAADRDRFRRDPAALVAAAHRHPYRTWFDRIMVEQREPYLGRTSETREAAFEQRVTRTAELYERIARDGFDPNHPIVPYTAERLLPTASGEVLTQRFYLGDGCHRLAILMSLGHSELPREWVRVKCFRRLRPLDNTAVLAPYVPVEWPAATTMASPVELV